MERVEAQRDYSDVITPEMFEMARSVRDAEKVLGAFEKTGFPELSPEDIEQLNLEIARGNSAAWEIAYANVGIARREARRVFNATRDNGALSLEDVVQESLIGLFKGARNFDGNVAAWPSYARKYAWGNAKKFVTDVASTVRLSQEALKDINRRDRFMHDYYFKHGHYPTNDLVIATIGISRVRLREIEVLRALTREMGSLDAGYSPQIDDPSDAGYGSYKHQIEKGEADPPIEDSPLGKARLADLLELIEGIDFTENQLILLTKLFGLDGNSPMTLSDIAPELDVTFSRARQIEGAALAKLKALRERICPTETTVYTRPVTVFEIDDFGRRVRRTEQQEIVLSHRFIE